MARIDQGDPRVFGYCARPAGKTEGGLPLRCAFEVSSKDMAVVLSRAEKHTEGCGGPVVIYSGQYTYVWPE